MPDQAEDLRRFVAQNETAEEYRAKLSRPAMLSPAERVATEVGKIASLPKLGYLWTALEEDLDRWVHVGGFDKPGMSTEALAEFWEMMQRRKEQSR